MIQLFYLLLVILFCISFISFAQNPEWINYTNGEYITTLEFEGVIVWIGIPG